MVFKQMTKDYAKKRRMQSMPVRRRNTIALDTPQTGMSAWIWMLSGLMLGVGVSALLYWSIQFSSKKHLSKPQLTIQKQAPETETRISVAKKTNLKTKPQTPPAEQEASSRFDFYTILPNMNSNGMDESARTLASNHTTLDLALSADLPNIPADTLAQAAEAEESVALQTAPVIEQPLPKSRFIVQVGAFRLAAKAEALKAELAFAGFQASIQTYKLDPKELRYQVFIGPFESKEQAQSQQYRLEQAQQHHSVVVKYRV
jgi:cell division protein FtsN